MFQKLKSLIKKHKFISVAVVLVLVGGGYYFYQSSTKSQAATRYVLGNVLKETLITSISGSGQVAASNQIDVKSKAAGDATFVGAALGQEVKAGALLLQLNAQDAQKAVRDAQSNLDSAKISLDKLVQPADQLSIIQAENALTSAQQAKAKAQDDLSKAYEDAFSNVSNAFLDLPTVITGVQDTLYKNTYSSSQNNLSYYTDLARKYDENVATYRDKANSDYQTARTAYDNNFIDYKSATRYDSNAAIELLLNETYNTTRLASDSVKSTDNFLSFVKDRLTGHGDPLPAQLAAHQANISSYTSKANSNLTTLLNSITTIKNSKEAITGDDLSIKEKTESLAKLKAGADPLDIQSQQLAIKQRENALLDAQAKLADYYVRAPFDGVAAKINFTKGDSVSSGAAIATIITKQRIAAVSLNEIDIAKVKVGQQASLSFDAIEGLSISGKVAQTDAIGAVTQGVVSYNVQIVFDTQDDRVKPGMTAQASIITDTKPDVLVVPNGAIKNQNGQKYVEVADQSASQPVIGSNSQVTLKVPPQRQTIEVGSANDALTEVISGLKEGDTIVVQTIAAGVAAASASSQSSGLRIPGITGGGGGGGTVNRAIRAD